MKKAVAVFGILVTVFLGLLSSQSGHFRAGTDASSDTEDVGYEYYYDEDNNKKEENAGIAVRRRSSEEENMIQVETDPDNIAVLVNRQYPLSKDYVPGDLTVPNIRFSFYGTYEKSYVRQETACALEKLFAAAAEQGVVLKGVSAYRSYARQQEIYEGNVRSRGMETTDLVSARPGTSEHQTGLSIDVSSDSVGCALEESFGDTQEGRWLADNCHKFGFIIRYPKDKTKITGYSYEPWHIRYVGKRLAAHLYKKDMTLEEYYQKTLEDDKIKEPVSQIDDTEGADTANGPELTAAPTPKVTRRPVENPASPSALPSATPGKTKKPAATAKPSQTRKPAATKKPKATSKPVKPTVTPAMIEETITPEETAPPAEPTSPQEPEAPVDGEAASVTQEDAGNLSQ